MVSVVLPPGRMDVCANDGVTSPGRPDTESVSGVATLAALDTVYVTVAPCAAFGLTDRRDGVLGVTALAAPGVVVPVVEVLVPDVAAPDVPPPAVSFASLLLH